MAQCAKGKMITIKQVNNDLAAMEREGLIKKAGHEYNPAGDPEQGYELTQIGDDKFWAYELVNLSETDRATLERCGYSVTAEGLKLYIEETQPWTREVLEQAQQAMCARQQEVRDRQRTVLLNLLAKMQNWERRIAAMS